MTDSTQHETSGQPEETPTQPLGTARAASDPAAAVAAAKRAAEQARADRLHTPQPGEAPTVPLTTVPGTDAPRADATHPEPTASAPALRSDPRPPARMSTIIWGLIIVVVGVGVVARALGADFEDRKSVV